MKYSWRRVFKREGKHWKEVSIVDALKIAHKAGLEGRPFEYQERVEEQ